MCNRVWTEGVFSLSLIIRTGVHGTLRHGLGDIWSLYHGVGGSYDICSRCQRRVDVAEVCLCQCQVT